MSYQTANLPPSIRKQAEDFIEFLLLKSKKEAKKTNPRLSIKGLYSGQFKMAEDFDDPLEEFNDYTP